MATYNDLVRRVFPDASDAECDHILWSKTPFPMLTAAKPLLRALKEYRDAAKRGTRLCDFCNEDAMPDSWACKGCDEALRVPDVEAVTQSSVSRPDSIETK